MDTGEQDARQARTGLRRRRDRMSDKVKHYYEARESSGQWRGVIYHYDPETLSRMIVDHRTDVTDDEPSALDLCADWLEANGMEAELS